MVKQSQLKKNTIFILLLIFIIKILLVSDLDIVLRYSPFDDNLYVKRTLELLQGDNSYSYDPYVLSKLPGMPIWLAINWYLGLPYLFTLNFLYGAAGLYFFLSIKPLILNNKIVILGFLLYSFNPITFSIGWQHVMREGISTTFFIILITSALGLLSNWRNNKYIYHLIIYIISILFIQVLREEDIVTWILCVLLFGIIYFRYSLKNKREIISTIGLLLIVPIILSLIVNQGIIYYNYINYGVALKTDYSDGEFPNLVKQLRRVENGEDNRLILIRQENLEKLKNLSINIGTLVDELPKPSKFSYSCEQSGVCSEWNGGYLIWWLKEASFTIGQTPTLKASQEYFSSIEKIIAQLCDTKKIECKSKSGGIFPTFEFKWIRAYVEELKRNISMLLKPNAGIQIFSENNNVVSRKIEEDYGRVIISLKQELNKSGYYWEPFWNIKNSVLFQILFTESLKIIYYLYSLIIIMGTISLIGKWTLFPKEDKDIIFLICTWFWAYAIFKLLIISYISLYFGKFEPRIVYSLYTSMFVLSIPMSLNFIKSLRGNNA